MQREKLYNLHGTATFTVVIFVFKINKILSDQISTPGKGYFFAKRRIRFFLISSFFYRIDFVKEKQTRPPDAA
jgi:hypothetical protein